MEIELTSVTSLAEAITPIVSVVAIVVGLVFQNRAHRADVDALTVAHRQELDRMAAGEQQRRLGRNRDLIFDELEPQLARLADADRAFWSLCGAAPELGFVVFNHPMSLDEPATALSGRPIEEEVRDLGLDVEIGRFALRPPDLELIEDTRLRMQLEVMTHRSAAGDAAEHARSRADIYAANLETLGEVRGELSSSIMRARLFGFDGLHAALEQVSAACQSVEMPAGMLVGVLRSDSPFPEDLLYTASFSNFLLSYAELFAVGQRRVLTEFRALMDAHDSDAHPDNPELTA